MGLLFELNDHIERLILLRELEEVDKLRLGRAYCVCGKEIISFINKNFVDVKWDLAEGDFPVLVSPLYPLGILLLL